MLSRPISSIGGGVSTGLYRVINVKDYGAKGDGVTDDTAAIGTAIAALGTYLRLFFPAGTYIVDSQLAIAVANATVFGEGRSASVIKLKNSSSITTGQAVLLLSAAGITVEDLGIDGNCQNNPTLTYYGILTAGIDDLKILNSIIRNTTDNGIYLQGAASPAQRFLIEGNYITNIGFEGIKIDYGKHGKILNNTIISTGSHGINLQAREPWASYAGTYDTQHTLVEGNYINRAVAPTNMKPGQSEQLFLICLHVGAKFNIINDNICWDNRNAGNDGIGLGQNGVNDPSDNIVTNNLVAYAGLFGIDAMNRSIVSGNYVYRAKYYGITAIMDIGGSIADVMIHSNTIIDPHYGGSAGYSTGILSQAQTAGSTVRNLSIKNNIVRDTLGNCLYGVTLDSTNVTFTDIEIIGNNCKAISTSSIRVMGTLSEYTGLIVKDNVEKTPFRTFTNADTTPSVLGGEIFKCSNTGATTVTAFDNGYTGQEIEVVFTTANTTINETGNIKLQGADAVNPAADDVYRFRFDGTSWFQVGGGAGGNDVDGGLIGESDTSGQTVDGGSL